MQVSKGRLLTGILIIALGVILLLNNFDVMNIDVADIIRKIWPLLLVLVGLNIVINQRDITGIMIGGIVSLLGIALLGRNFGLITFDMSYIGKALWPLIIILIGISILGKSHRNSRGNLAIMGAVDKTKTEWELVSGDYSAIMGGVELDLRKAQFKEREVTLNLTAIMGGINITIPEDLAVTCQGTAVLGGVEMLGKGSGGIIGTISSAVGDPNTASYVLYLNCICIMGGIEIKR
jgi:predicted membrane protein